GHSQNIKLFELGTVFYPTQSSTILPDQPTELGLVATPSDFRYFKGEMEFLLKSLNLEVSLIRAKKKQPFFHPQNQATVFLEQSPVGKLGEILPPLLPLDTPPAYGLTLNITKLMPHLSLGHSYPPQYPYPPFIEDYTFMLPPKTPIGHVLDDILATSKLVERANLKTIFRQNYTFTIHFRDPPHPQKDCGESHQTLLHQTHRSSKTIIQHIWYNLPKITLVINICLMKSKLVRLKESILKRPPINSSTTRSYLS
ncbi:MAG: hypothetical protein HYS86_02090, partial [Candidatus Chisholmbacteria bacterium]|nr:hypothetical protein [Candidatus Chisholmbacteria bacterium]